MATHRFAPTRFYNVIGTADAVLRIADGDRVVTTTLDAWGFDAHGAQLADRPNPMTGPFFIENAEPGDTLSVWIERMTPNREMGWTFSALAPNVIEPGFVAGFPERRRVEWIIDAAGGTVRLADPPDRLRDWSLPLAPMIGCFGVAPAMGQAISTATSGPYGGNMDYRAFGPGTTAFFPVSEPGALFYLGDGHACQGDGEIVGTGIETSFEIEFTVRVLKGKTHRLAARGDCRRHLHGRQRTAARSGSAARDHRDDALAGKRFSGSTRPPRAISLASASATTSPMSSTPPIRSSAAWRNAGWQPEA